MNEFEKMISGKLYNASKQEIKDINNRCRELIDIFNKTKLNDFATRYEIGRKLFGALGSNAVINRPFICDYGCNIYIGDNFYMNYDCIFLDTCKIVIGNNVMLGPRVSIYTPIHPLDSKGRNSGLEYGAPVIIGDNVWIGGSAVIKPGVTIGNNVVVGCGAVVTKNIPDNVVVAGNPAKIIKEITENDRLIYMKMEKEYYEI